MPPLVAADAAPRRGRCRPSSRPKPGCLYFRRNRSPLKALFGCQKRQKAYCFFWWMGRPPAEGTGCRRLISTGVTLSIASPSRHFIPTLGNGPQSSRWLRRGADWRSRQKKMSRSPCWRGAIRQIQARTPDRLAGRASIFRRMPALANPMIDSGGRGIRFPSENATMQNASPAGRACIRPADRARFRLSRCPSRRRKRRLSSTAALQSKAMRPVH